MFLFVYRSNQKVNYSFYKNENNNILMLIMNYLTKKQWIIRVLKEFFILFFLCFALKTFLLFSCKKQISKSWNRHWLYHNYSELCIYTSSWLSYISFNLSIQTSLPVFQYLNNYSNNGFLIYILFCVAFFNDSFIFLLLYFP